MYRLMMGPAAFTKGLDTWFRDFYGQVGTVVLLHAHCFLHRITN